MPPAPPPAYPLRDLQQKVRIGHYQITRTARQTASSLGLDEGDITACVLSLTAEHFYKTMVSEKVPGTSQDVYRTDCGDMPVYVKLTLGARSRPTVVVLFKRDMGASGTRTLRDDEQG